ncbi:uncharacterized protein I303_107985 [Kwoniella dejecticola CBS 10117]|uniref:Uncharacterized protein n=1 Tax=Kwoniella dejecticola CBS 10117 TaxID=1296121 RepID=A0A1A5ZW79_9TREE|nr:uncharacterized protein I303_07977 [Kwoniella dejecticola CBS 10117]OBR82063.1 hypothetical protein I303_07977 [Kwoniella dejecticola CBS 10117]
MTGTSEDLPKPPEPLAQPIRLIVALASLSAISHPVSLSDRSNPEWYKATSSKWLSSVCKLISFDQGRLPPAISPGNVKESANDQREEWSADEITRIAGVLIEASLASENSNNTSGSHKKGEEAEGVLRYSPIARSLSYRTLKLLGLDAKNLIPRAEKNLSSTLFHALKAAAEKENQEKVEKARQAQSQGWGGSLGRHLATGAGVVAGGVLLGVTGGLAAPAIAAVLAPLGVGSILSAGAAPVVLGTLFGVGGGGLAGKRVRERWRGVEEFSFIEIGDGHKATKEELDDLKEAKARRDKQKSEEQKKSQDQHPEKKPKVESEQGQKEEVTAETEGEVSEQDAEVMVEQGRLDIEDRLLKLSLESGTRSSLSLSSDPSQPPPPYTQSPTSSPRASLDQGRDEKALTEVKKPPSLVATIIVPGLLTSSRTEGITAWRAICSSATTFSRSVANDESSAVTTVSGLKDGRDVYLLRFESAAMLKTGRDVDLWVTSKLKGLVKKEIIKRTVLSAYFAAVSLPLSVYSMATMTLDNTWMHAVDRAKKAGRLLGEVIEKRVQGERPVVLVGSSVGALTILHALLYLSSLPPPPGSRGGSIPAFVESAYLISLPSAPTAEEWQKVRSVTSRRVVNAYSDADLVLAGVVRLHEVVSRAAVMSNGIKVSGLGPVEQPGIEDIDVSSVLRGHMEIQAKMPEILKLIDIDA